MRVDTDYRGQQKTLTPVRPNAGIEAAYRKKLDALIAEMHKSLAYWLIAAYRANEPEMAQDAPPDASGGVPIQRSPAMALRDRMRQLTRHWQKRFDEAATDLAKYFATAAAERSDTALRSILKRGGFTVKFRLTRAANDVLQATIGENVSLIKSIASQHLTQVEGLVMRSVTAGRDLETLAKGLQEQFGVTKRRAALIARTQNAMATAAMTRVRHRELGITEAIWRHSHAGREPRPTHLANNGKKYTIAEGWVDPAEGRPIWPGELINCLPGDALVDLVNGCHKVWRYHYRGDLVTFEAGQAVIRATPNHPFLTSKGWVSAQALNDGDYVWQAWRKEVQSCVHDGYETKFRISDIFGALSRLSTTSITSGQIDAVFDFHGDIPNAEVESVGAELGLLGEFNMCADQRIAKLTLAETDSRRVVSGAVIAKIGDTLAPSMFGEAPEGKRIGASEPQCVGFASVARSDPVALQASGHQCAADVEMVGDRQDAVAFVEHADYLRVREIVKILTWRNTTASHDANDHLWADAECLGDGGNGIASAMKRNDFIKAYVDAPMSGADAAIGDGIVLSAEILAQLVRVNFEMGRQRFQAGEFSFQAIRVSKKTVGEYAGGHVYTIQSNNGWYSTSTENLVSQNCRCVSLPVVPGFS